jgi:hypothetical protein
MALDGGTVAPWVTDDEVYGADPGLRRELEARGTGYVLAVACSHLVTTALGRQRADAIAAAALPRRAWQRMSAGQGSKGPRFYDWAWITIDARAAPAGQRSLLIRRSNTTSRAPVERACLAGGAAAASRANCRPACWSGSVMTCATSKPGSAASMLDCAQRVPVLSWVTNP